MSELLWITREQAKSRPEVATGGAFQLTLGRDVPVQMIRVGLPQGTDLYPEISGSHYRCSVRFLIWQDAATRAGADHRGRAVHAFDLHVNRVAPRVVPCPTCNRPVEWTDASPWRPFCSERCRLIDLGAWVSEQRGIAGEERAGQRRCIGG